MGRIGKAFKFQMDNKFNLFKSHDLKALLVAITVRVLIFVGIAVGLYLLLAQMFTMLNLQVNASFLAFALLGCQAILFFFDIANIITTMYLSKDNELLMVLPIKFNEIFVSKILVLYVSDLIFTFTYLLPVFITVGILGQLSHVYYITAALLVPILPVLPIAIASLLSIPTMLAVRFLKKHVSLSVAVILVIVAVVFIAYMQIVTNMSGAFNIADRQIESSLKINQTIREWGAKIFGYYHLAQSLFSFSLIYYPLVFFVISLIIFCVCFLLIRPFYFKIATMSTENGGGENARAKAFKCRKPFTALLLNEIRSVFRSPSYLFQYFLFPLFMPLIVYVYDKLLISIAVNQAGQNMIIGSHVLVLSIIALMSNTISSTAISREGGTFYIAKCAPVSFYVQVKAKIAFNAIFTVGAIFITTVTTLILTDYSTLMVIFASVCVAVMALGHICHSFDLDLMNPVLDWYDNSEISTISKSTTVSIVYALVLSFISCLIIILTASISLYAAFGILFAVALFYCLSRMYLLAIRTKYYYEKMEI